MEIRPGILVVVDEEGKDLRFGLVKGGPIQATWPGGETEDTYSVDLGEERWMQSGFFRGRHLLPIPLSWFGGHVSSQESLEEILREYAPQIILNIVSRLQELNLPLYIFLATSYEFDACLKA